MQKPAFILLVFGIICVAATIDIDNLFPYSQQEIPSYVAADNTPSDNPITDAGATLGRVLFYDKQLSEDMTVSCASCHHQEFAFGDTAKQSIGVSGLTGRHSMRLVNARFSEESNYFWDERAESLEEQTTMPIKDHIEMGFSGFGGHPTINSLFDRMAGIEYYQVLFPLVFGSSEITEERIQFALAQFIRSIQSFDTPFDDGMNLAPSVGAPFPNFTNQENLGKQLFLLPRPQGGAGCAGCHSPPEFNIDPLSLNNGVIGMVDTDETDLTNTKSPSLRELVNPSGEENGPFMHDASLETLADVIDHYDFIVPNPENTNLDPRLQGPPLNLTDTEKAALVAFLKTLSGTDVYSAAQWSDPFGEDETIDLIGGTTNSENTPDFNMKVYPNPFREYLLIESRSEQLSVEFYNLNGALVKKATGSAQEPINASELPKGVYLLHVKFSDNGRRTVKVVKH